MPNLSFDNPVFVTYVIAALIMSLKYAGQSWMTIVLLMSRKAGFAAPEDAAQGMFNPEPRPGQLDPDPVVERSRRMHRNDTENLPNFWIVGLLFTLTAPPLWLAQVCLYGYVAARLVHGWAYATARSHEIRGWVFTVTALFLFYMIGHTFWIAVASF